MSGSFSLLMKVSQAIDGFKLWLQILWPMFLGGKLDGNTRV